MRSSRREFLKTGATIAATGALTGATSQGVSIIVDPTDAIASAPPAVWAAKELETHLAAAHVPVRRFAKVSQAPANHVCIVAAGMTAPVAREALKGADVTVASAPEALAVVPSRAGGRSILLATGHDTRALVYALLDLSDRVQNASDPQAVLNIRTASAERPANLVRSVMRMFCSDVEDKPWYNDREMWPEYLTMLAAQRFNRFNLALGIGYDFIRQVTDAYFLFAYPFLLDVPGYKVRVPQLPESERDRNLEMLRFISEQTVARGIEFQLGIWTHGYEWINSPNPNYTIEGVTRENHGPYCRDAVRMLLKSCPAISGITFRVHGESGVEEGSYDFWKTVFEGVATCGRTVRIDMHAKGMDQTMEDVGLATGMPITIAPKYWAEHMGMPYMQAEIRELERPRAGRQATGLMKLSAGSRSFLRYGYGDLMREDRRWGIIHRIWPGTQRLLIWGDPVTAAAHARAFTFCGSDGVELMEPLSFKGRRGSGIAGDRCGYADQSLRTRWDWQKYLYTYRVWGRSLYNPDRDPDVWRRYLTKEFGPAALQLDAAVANATRILPIITTTHGASAGNNTYWPEMYVNQSLIDAEHPAPYSDTPAPKVFGNVSPLDPQLFSRINDFADELLNGKQSGKYSPIEVAQWIEDYAGEAARNLAQAESKAAGKSRPEYRRLNIDVALQAGLGRFFGAKLRSAVLYRIYEQTGDRTALEESLKAYRSARTAWAELANTAKGIYMADVTAGEHRHLRGHWLDRLPAIDADIAAIEKKLAAAKPGEPQTNVHAAIRSALERPSRTSIPCRHTPAPRFAAGKPLEIDLWLEKQPSSVLLHYRHVNQAERYQSAEMRTVEGRYRATIPGNYTESPYPLEYYFEVKPSAETAFLYPGFSPELTNQPYFVVRRA